MFKDPKPNDPEIVTLPTVVTSSVINVPVMSAPPAETVNSADDESVPVTAVLADRAIVPVPPGFKVNTAFELVEISESFIMILSIATLPVITGAVNVLPDNICVPVSVATVESMLRVSVSPDTADVNPVPPAIWNVSPEFTAVPVLSSPTKVNACDVFCASM